MNISAEAVRKTVQTSPLHQKYMEKMKKDFEYFEKTPIPVITYSLFRRFYDDGNRIVYEHKYYFKRRERLAKCALLYMVYKEKKYLKMLEDVIWTICDEFTWSLPAHIWGDDFENVSGYRYLIDLFAAETGFALSEIYYLLKEDFSDMLRKRVEYEVKDRIIDAFLNRTQGFPFETKINNWSAVCAGSVGAAFIYMADRSMFDKAYPRIQAAINCFLKSYGDDGCCAEGLGYWEYGFGFYTYFGELLRRYTEGETDYFADEKVHNIAKFQQTAILRGCRTISFSDGFETTLFHQGLSRFLANEFDDVRIPDMRYDKTPDDDSCFRWAAILRDFVWTYDAMEIDNDTETYEYKENAQWYIKKCSGYSFAAKGGNNAEPHNHNDLGHFMLAVKDETPLTDLGSGEYTREYFGAGRYDIVNNASWGHSIPEINGISQQEGEQYRTQVLNADEKQFALQLKNAYDIKELDSFIRRFEFSQSGVTITDSFEGAITSVKERFITKTEPEVQGSVVKIDGITMVFEKGAQPCITSYEFKNHDAETETVYFIDVMTTGKTFKAEIIV